MTDNTMFAEPSVGSGPKTKNFKLAEPGKYRFRIGPAYASLASSGRWNVSINQHYGYRSAGDEENPQGFPRTFICTLELDKATGMVKKRCPEHEDVDALKEKVKIRETKLKEEGKSEEEIATILGAQKKYIKEHNLDKKHLVIAKNEQGEWGVLWLPWKALEALIARRKTVRDEHGIDILSTKEGCWVEFTRAGTGFNNTTYSCDVAMIQEVLPNGKKAMTFKQEALTEADKDAIIAGCPDLSTVGTRLTEDQIQRLVDSRGDTDVVEAVFREARETKKGLRGREDSANEATPSPKIQSPKVAPPKEVVQATPAPAPTVKKPEITPQEPHKPTADEVDIDAQIAALMAAKAAKAKTQTKSIQVEVSPDTDPETLPDDQFIGVFGKKK